MGGHLEYFDVYVSTTGAVLPIYPPRHPLAAISYNTVQDAAVIITEATDLQIELARLIAIYAIHSTLDQLLFAIATTKISQLSCTEQENFIPLTANPLHVSHKNYSFVEELIFQSKGRALSRACEFEHLATARWMYQTLGLTVDNARYNKGQILRNACWRGSLPIAQWLVETFELTAADVRTDENSALIGACTGGHLAMAQWLVATFDLTAMDLCARGRLALHRARREGHGNVVEWIEDVLASGDLRRILGP